jgi:UDP-N-acetylmuramyl pentapeptide synthase
MGDINLSAQSLAETHNYLRLASLVELGEDSNEHEIAILEDIKEQTETIRTYVQEIGLIGESTVTAKQVIEKMGGDYFEAPAEILSICVEITNKMALFVSAHNRAIGKEIY